MKLSEFIKELETSLKEKGDLIVQFSGEINDYECEGYFQKGNILVVGLVQIDED